MNINPTGTLGEEAAVQYLKSKGYKILKCNYACRFGEIDIIARLDRFICFVEVKTRSENSIATPREFITSVKQGKIFKTAEYYIMCNSAYIEREELQPRFDCIEVYLVNGEIETVNHLENAF